MKKFILCNNNHIPPIHMKDTKELQEFIKSNMDIDISLQDTYLLWDSISDSWDAVWLDINIHPEGETREEFLKREMCKRGYLVDESSTLCPAYTYDEEEEDPDYITMRIMSDKF